LAEQRTLTPKVAGSLPATSTIFLYRKRVSSSPSKPVTPKNP